MHSLSKYVVSIYYMPETPLGAGETTVKKIYKFPSLVWQGKQRLIEEPTWGPGHFREW